jgi:hypothetical protein
MSSSSYSTFNLFFSILKNVYHCLMKYCENNNYSLSNITTTMKEKYNKYWGDFEAINPLLFIASLLDPRYKIFVLEFWFQANVGIIKAKDIVDSLKVSWTSYINIMLRMKVGLDFQMKSVIAQVLEMWVLIRIFIIHFRRPKM